MGYDTRIVVSSFSMGASIKDVQARLGHTDIQTTMNIYAHVTKEEKKDTADKFARFYGKLKKFVNLNLKTITLFSLIKNRSHTPPRPPTAQGSQNPRTELTPDTRASAGNSRNGL